MLELLQVLICYAKQHGLTTQDIANGAGVRSVVVERILVNDCTLYQCERVFSYLRYFLCSHQDTRVWFKQCTINLFGL